MSFLCLIFNYLAFHCFTEMGSLKSQGTIDQASDCLLPGMALPPPPGGTGGSRSRRTSLLPPPPVGDLLKLRANSSTPSITVNSASSSDHSGDDDDHSDDDALNDDDDDASQTEQEAIANYRDRYERRRSRAVLYQLSGTYKNKHQKKLQLNKVQ